MALMSRLRAACERALAANEQHERLIAAMLTLARSERGLDRFDPFDLGEITEEALVSSQAGPDLHIVADLNPAPALGDTDLAGRLVANLIDNAVRYNIPGGQLEIATGLRGGRPFIAVANTGPHVPPDQLGRLFLPFERMDGRRAGAAAGGLGLGLAIVTAIAAAHGAELHAQPGEQGGLAIEILFAQRETSFADLTEDNLVGTSRLRQARPELPSRRGQRYRPAVRRGRLLQRPLGIVPRDQVREHQLPHSRLRRMLPSLPP